MLSWATRVIERLCVPGVETTQIANAKQFSIVLAAVTEQIQKSAERYAENFLSPLRALQKKRQIVPDQTALATRVRNVSAMFLSNFILLRWQIAAVFSVFLNLVEREVFADHEGASEKKAQYNSFYTFQDGYSAKYNRTLRDISIGDKINEKLEHACFGRFMIWAHALYNEMKFHLDHANVDPRVLFMPVYIRMKESKHDSLSSVLEFFMRLLYVSTVRGISEVLERETTKGITTIQNPHAYCAKYFNTWMAVMQHTLIAPPNKRAKVSHDDDDDENKPQGSDNQKLHETAIKYQEQLAQFTEQRRQELCNGVEYSPACLPHPRTTSLQLEVTQFESIFSILDATGGSLFGDESTCRESSRCLWVVWLQNVEKMFSIFRENNIESKGGAKSSLGTIEERRKTLLALIACTPKPNAFVCIMTMLLRSIEQHQATLFKETGFDLNRDGLIDRLFTHIGTLCNFYQIINCTVHEQKFVDNKILP